ncbi:MAG: T9SS type A sorting domain-containing protein [Bacteriodetes bacterium]|nr:T9SS type A sorting domain-containing protein [Bacteroidota bacterium]
MKYPLALLLLSCTFYISAHFGSLNQPELEYIETPGYENDFFERAKLEFEKTMDPALGEVPIDIREKERAFVATLPTRQSLAMWSTQTADTLLHLPTTWENTGIEKTGGRTRSLAMDVGNENILLAGAVGGGVWRTTNSGTSWVKTTANSELHSVSSIAQDKRMGKRDVWYYGTGEYYSPAGYPTYNWDIGEGMYKSVNGGKSWVKLSATSVQRTDTARSPFHFIHNIATDPTRNDSDIVYAACVGAIMRSNDGGASWKVALGSLNTKTSVWSDVTVASNGAIYATLSTGNYMGIYRSVNGVTWTNITPSGITAIQRARVAYAPSNPNTVWVYVSGNSGITVWKYKYISGNGSASGGEWSNRSSAISSKLSVFGTYCMQLTVSPDNEDKVLIGGTDSYYTTDGFSTSSNVTHVGGYSEAYKQTGQWDPVDPNAFLFNGHHPDEHGAVFLPSNPKVVYSCNDGGVFRTDDITQGVNTQWQSINSNYVVAQFYSVGIDPVGNHDNILIAGAQDNNASAGMAGSGKPLQWILGGDGMICDVAADASAFYPSSQNANVYRVQLDANFDVTNYTCVRPNGISPTFTNPLRLDPTNDSILYLLDGYRGIWVNSNLYGIPMVKGKNSIATNWEMIPLQSLWSNTQLTAFDVSRSSKRRIYIATRGGKIARIDYPIITAENPRSIKAMTQINVPSTAYALCVTVDPFDEDNVFVVFSNYGVKSIFNSTNGGETWKSVSGNLEEKPDGSGYGPSVRCFEILHYKGQTLYIAGTSSGVFTTNKIDGDNTIWTFEPSIGNVNINMIRARSTDGFVAIASHGLGVFSGYAIPYEPSNTSVNDNTVSTNVLLHPLYPNPCYNNAQVHFTLAKESSVRLSVFDELGKRVLELPQQAYSSGEHTVPLDVHALPVGNYILQCENGRTRLTKKMSIVR